MACSIIRGPLDEATIRKNEGDSCAYGHTRCAAAQNDRGRRNDKGPPGEFRWRERLRTRSKRRGFATFTLKDSEKAPGGCGACERISTRTSVREKSLEHSSAPPGAFAASSHFAGCKPAKPITSCPCRRPGLLRRERRGRGRPWGSR